MYFNSVTCARQYSSFLCPQLYAWNNSSKYFSATIQLKYLSNIFSIPIVCKIHLSRSKKFPVIKCFIKICTLYFFTAFQLRVYIYINILIQSTLTTLSNTVHSNYFSRPTNTAKLFLKLKTKLQYPQIYSSKSFAI